MNSQEIIKLTAAFAALLCIITGIVALFRGLKADGVVDFSAIAKGKLKTGSAGIVLLFFGSVIFTALILKGRSYEHMPGRDLIYESPNPDAPIEYFPKSATPDNH